MERVFKQHKKSEILQGGALDFSQTGKKLRGWSELAQRKAGELSLRHELVSRPRSEKPTRDAVWVYCFGITNPWKVCSKDSVVLQANIQTAISSAASEVSK